MVSKKTNKISPKDINLLLNKLVIIIKKFSNSYGNKKKRVSRKVGVTGGDGGIFSIFGNNKHKDKSLDDEIHYFLSTIFNDSQNVFKNIDITYFKKKGIEKIFTIKNIDLIDKDKNFHNTGNFQYNKRDSSIINFIVKNKDKIIPYFETKNPWYIQEFNNYDWIFCFKDEYQLLHPNTENVGYITFKFENHDINSAFRKVNPYYQYYMLNKEIYNSINSNNDFDISSIEKRKIIKEYIRLEEDKIKPIINSPTCDYKKLDTLIMFYYYSKYITEDIKQDINTDNNVLINLRLLIKSQEKFGIYDKYILKHAVIYNIGVTLKLIQEILNSSDS
jgi:hypothetical protein